MNHETANKASLSAREKAGLIEQTKKQITNLFRSLGYLDQGIVILDLLNEMDLPEWGENIKEMLDIGFQTKPRKVGKKD